MLRPEIQESAEPFDLPTYLSQRDKQADFILVELGHGARPIAYKQPRFIGQRAYIGVEAWLRDPSGVKREHLQELRQTSADNIFYIEQPLQGEIKRSWQEEKSPTLYVGEYDPTTILPDAVADEVFVSNVFGDPHIADRLDSTPKLINEVNRLLKPSGRAVIRETITPHRARLGEKMLQAAGLQADGVFNASNGQGCSWDTLEAIYGDEKHQPEPYWHGFYLFLSKI